MRAFVIAAAAAGLAGCATGGDTDPGPPPTDYRQLIREYVRSTFFDPYSIRDAQLAPPKPGSIYVEGTLRHASGWVVCMRANAKNRMGAYTGLKDTAFLINGGRVEASLTAEPTHYDIRTNCAGANYEPFRELEAAQVAPRG